MTKISEHFSYAEVVKSQTASRLGIKNDPTEEHLENIIHLANNILEPVRSHFFDKYGQPLKLSSWYRSQALNEAIPGSSLTSQHCKGEAADLDGDLTGIPNKEIFEFIKNNLIFDQLILEYPDENGNPAWVHVSLKKKGVNRKQVLVKRHNHPYEPYAP